MTMQRSRIIIFSAIFLSACLAAPLAAQINQMNRITRFNKVPIPVDLYFGKSILPKGTYDLEFLRVPNPKAYYLRIMKKGRILHLVQGKDYPYTEIKQIPIAPKLHLSRDTAANMLIIVMDSGAYTKPYSKCRARYCIACEGGELPKQEAAEAPPEGPPDR
jgi:hypothetical protein